MLGASLSSQPILLSQLLFGLFKWKNSTEICYPLGAERPRSLLKTSAQNQISNSTLVIRYIPTYSAGD